MPPTLLGADMNIHTAISSQLSAVILQQLGDYRHRVFVEQLGWRLSCENALEFDQFDRADTVYVVARDHIGNINGCARLLPTTQPYLLADVFPELLHGAPPPRATEIWELSRFAAMDFEANSNIPAGQFSSPIALNILRSAIDFAQQRGIRYLITVSPIGVERLLRKAGAKSHRLGPPRLVNDHWLYACMIHCDLDDHLSTVNVGTTQ